MSPLPQQCFAMPNMTALLLIPFLHKHLPIMLCAADQKCWLWSVFPSVHMVLRVASRHCSSARTGHFRVAEVINVTTRAVFLCVCAFLIVLRPPWMEDAAPSTGLVSSSGVGAGSVARLIAGVYKKVRRWHRQLRGLENETCDVVTFKRG